jgi:hypothetical protein
MIYVASNGSRNPWDIQPFFVQLYRRSHVRTEKTRRGSVLVALDVASSYSDNGVGATGLGYQVLWAPVLAPSGGNHPLGSRLEPRITP